jgi:hypothetical protein
MNKKELNFQIGDMLKYVKSENESYFSIVIKIEIRNLLNSHFYYLITVRYTDGRKDQFSYQSLHAINQKVFSRVKHKE